MDKARNCCRGHGDLDQRSANVVLPNALELTLKGLAPVPVPQSAIATTRFWEDLNLEGMPTFAFSADQVCDAHQRNTCLHGFSCTKIHICRELWTSVTKPFTFTKQKPNAKREQDVPGRATVSESAEAPHTVPGSMRGLLPVPGAAQPPAEGLLPTQPPVHPPVGHPPTQPIPAHDPSAGQFAAQTPPRPWPPAPAPGRFDPEPPQAPPLGPPNVPLPPPPGPPMEFAPAPDRHMPPPMQPGPPPPPPQHAPPPALPPPGPPQYTQPPHLMNGQPQPPHWQSQPPAAAPPTPAWPAQPPPAPLQPSSVQPQPLGMQPPSPSVQATLPPPLRSPQFADRVPYPHPPMPPMPPPQAPALPAHTAPFPAAPAAHPTPGGALGPAPERPPATFFGGDPHTHAVLVQIGLQTLIDNGPVPLSPSLALPGGPPPAPMTPAGAAPGALSPTRPAGVGPLSPVSPAAATPGPLSPMSGALSPGSAPAFMTPGTPGPLSPGSAPGAISPGTPLALSPAKAATGPLSPVAIQGPQSPSATRLMGPAGAPQPAPISPPQARQCGRPAPVPPLSPDLIRSDVPVDHSALPRESRTPTTGSGPWDRARALGPSTPSAGTPSAKAPSPMFPGPQLIPNRNALGCSPILIPAQELCPALDAQWPKPPPADRAAARESPLSAAARESPLSSMGPSDGDSSDDDRVAVTPAAGDRPETKSESDAWDVRARASRGKFKGLRGSGLLGVQMCSAPEGRGFAAGRGRVTA